MAKRKKIKTWRDLDCPACESGLLGLGLSAVDSEGFDAKVTPCDNCGYKTMTWDEVHLLNSRIKRRS